MNKAIVIACTMGFVAGPAFTAEVPRLDRTKLNIGTYHMAKTARAEENVKDVKDCGIDFVIGAFARPTLDLMQKHGLGVFQEGVTPGWWGGAQGERNGKMREINTMDKYDRAAEGFRDHPAIWAIDVGDEPSAMDFAYYGEIVSHTKAHYPHQLVYLNLYPNYASAASLSRSQAQSQLGTATYREHLMTYCQHVPLDYICFDCYAWGWGNKPPVLIENLRQVSIAALGSKKDLWVVLQGNRHVDRTFNNRAMTEETLGWQANVALAYGAQLLSWACWADGAGWWRENAVTSNGVKSATYYNLQAVNRRLHKTGERYMKYRPLGTDLVGFDATYWQKVSQASLAAANDAAFVGLKATDGAALAVGHMVARDGSGDRAVYVAACDAPEGERIVSHTLVFTAPRAAAVSAWNEAGAVPLVRAADGTYSLKLRSCRGMLIEAKEK